MVLEKLFQDLWPTYWALILGSAGGLLAACWVAALFSGLTDPELQAVNRVVAASEAARCQERRQAARQALAADPGAWQVLTSQVLAEVRGTPTQVTDRLPWCQAAPAPYFTIQEPDARYVFTTDPRRLRRARLLPRRTPVTALATLDGALPGVVQELFTHLAQQQLRAATPGLPQDTAWYVAAGA